MRTLLLTGTSLLALITSPTLMASIASAETLTSWSSVTAGTLGPASVAMTGFTGIPGPSLENLNLSGSNFSAAPGPSVALVPTYEVRDNWSAHFSTVLPALDLYLVFWRGIFANDFEPAVNFNYTFGSPFTVLSGLAGATHTGNTLQVSTTGFYSGIVEFTNVADLALTTDTLGHSAQGLTFGLPTATLVPEPASLPLMSLAVAGFGLMALRHRA